jgi:hypothetical protein
VSLRDAPTNVAHDLLDIRLVAARPLLALLLLLLLGTASVGPPAVSATAAAMEVSAPSMRW